MRILHTVICQQIWQPKNNRWLSRNIKSYKTESWRNRQHEWSLAMKWLVIKNSQQIIVTGSSTKHNKMIYLNFSNYLKIWTRKTFHNFIHDATFTFDSKTKHRHYKKERKKIRDQYIQCIKTQNSNTKY